MNKFKLTPVLIAPLKFSALAETAICISSIIHLICPRLRCRELVILYFVGRKVMKLRMKNILKSISIIAGVLLITNALILAVVANFNLGTILTLTFGVLFSAYGIFFDKVNIMPKTGFLKWLKYITFLGLALIIALIAFLAVYGNNDNVTYNENAVIVLGAGVKGEIPTLPLIQRLDKTIDFYQRNPNIIIVVSGGKGFQESITEALAMERYLINKGIPKENIIKEEQATSTYENFVYSKQILDDYFKLHNLGEQYKTTFITNDFHIYRSNKIAKFTGFENITHYHGITEWYTLPPNYLRECSAVLKLWILGN